MGDRPEFTPYDASHVVALVVLLVGAVALVVFGRRARRTDPEDRTGRVFAVLLLAGTIPLQAIYFTPAYFSLDRTLPVQLCDLASFVAAYALFTHRPRAVALTYLWGIPLTTQAVLTPDLATGFPHPVFVLFWTMHVAIIWAAVYLTFGRGLGPSWSDYRFAIVVTAVWAVLVFCFNLAFDTNYGFLNGKPAGGSILDLLGPWPWYIGAQVVLISAVWAVMTAPYAGLSRSRPPRRRDPAVPGRHGPDASRP